MRVRVQMVRRSRGTADLPGAYSQKLVTGTKQRCPANSHGRHQSVSALRTFVTAVLVPRWGGGGKPQRIIASSRMPSAPVRTTGALWSGKTAGNGGKLLFKSRTVRASWRIAPWLVVRAYKLHMGETIAPAVAYRETAHHSPSGAFQVLAGVHGRPTVRPCRSNTPVVRLCGPSDCRVKWRTPAPHQQQPP